MMLDRISEKEEISIIEQKDKFIIIQPGKYIYGALICKANLFSVQILLNGLIEKIEKIYSHILKNWNGDLKMFKPITEIVRDHFF